jgi:phosphoglycolate phosphatase
VLFDLDGTLLDSAPDMLATANRMRAARGLAPMAMSELRPHVSRGSRAMLEAGFPGHDPRQRDAMVAEFLDLYLQELGRHSVLFPSVEETLEALDDDGVKWGIVTNKPEYLAREILPQHGWQLRCAVLIGGDTLPQRKPHPLPLQTAAQQMGFVPAQCVYVGDDARDIEAARAAGMPSIAALWGYRQESENPSEWGADVLLEDPARMLEAASWPRCR